MNSMPELRSGSLKTQLRLPILLTAGQAEPKRSYLDQGGTIVARYSDR